MLDMIETIIPIIFWGIALYGIWGMLSIEPDTGERIHPPKDDNDEEEEQEQS